MITLDHTGLADTMADRAYDVVENLIVTLDLAPGTVFSEGTLADRIGIGRTPLREALQRLASDRLITILPRRGVMVSQIDLVDFLALLETRRVLDRLIVGSATRRADPESRARLESLSDAMQRAAENSEIATFMRLDREADTLMATAARNPHAVSAVSPLHAHCRRFWIRYRHDGDASRSALLHGLMLKAAAEGDEAAAVRASDALVDYLENLTRSILNLQ